MKNKLQKEIKEMELEKRKTIETKEEKVNAISFDTWWFLRSSKIPSNHMKEIITVDFKARGLSQEETVEAYDEALSKYGIKLN